MSMLCDMQVHKDVLAARYRDVAPDVRATVVAAIGELCHDRPSDFLQDSHLRYIAWALSDEVCCFVRCFCVMTYVPHALGMALLPRHTCTLPRTVACGSCHGR